MSENEPEGEERESFAGEERLLGGEPPARDPYTPEPGPRPGEQRAFNLLRWAWVPILVAALLIVIAIFR
jgi:hypothetical protein